MGVIGKILGIGKAVDHVGGAVENVAEVFVSNRTKALQAAHGQYASEFGGPSHGPFDDFVNGLNRLPRPILALGTVGLFVYAMIDPYAFSIRMQGLDTVPDQLWWLLGAIVSFYFGARELHHARRRKLQRKIEPQSFAVMAGKSSENAALDEWRGLNR
ncbi:methionine synthase I [Amylibacter sp. SFDW26]|uniref:holin family protein n=1 Tax=Amylibacter sp. SFDW26 TaxID=2652722 RepID=UPI0012614152|nr:holin family protein [Amylibacter sp. SFDW26]KAB7615674.1 methionine synthase I [Amylibacter sp. SFDW26]